RVRPGEDVAALTDRLETFALRADGRRSLATFGSRCGELFAAAAELASRPDAYRQADRWVRISPAHAPRVSDAPVDRVRRERVRGYLAFQARRTFEDHWYGEGNTRYYDDAARQLKSDADAVVAALALTDAPFAPYLVPAPEFPVVPKLPTRVSITDEPTPAVRVGFRANATPGVAGFPVFWTDPMVRTPISTAPGDTTLSRNLTRPALPRPLVPKAQTEALVIDGFFRGRSLRETIPVDFYPVPDRTAVSAPLPQTVGIAVRADDRTQALYGFGTGAVAIVLDCSGSMARTPTSAGLYPEALDAFEKLLRGLPPGTVVTVWAFGQKTLGIKTPEETIRELQEPVELPPDRTRIIEDVLQKARGLEPWHESPVVRAAVTAKNRVRDYKLPFKAVVLLSDGVDNRFAADPDYGGKKRTIGDVLRAEFPPEVAFGVVAFPVGREEQPVQGEFKLVEKLMPTGLFVEPKDVQKLIDWLRTGLNPRVRYALKPRSADARPVGGDLIAGTAAADNWHTDQLVPGTYLLSVRGHRTFTSEIVLPEIVLSPGVRLLLVLVADGEELSVRRHWFADTARSVKKTGPPGAPWRMALLQNWAKAGRLELSAAIEANPDEIDHRSPTQIGDAWFEVTPAPNAEPAAVRWRAEGGFPAPVWSLGSPGWPLFPGTTTHAAPRLDAWWSRDPFPAAGAIDAPEGGVRVLNGRAQAVAGAEVTFEAVAVEEHEVDVSPGVREKRSCLVVRLSHAAGAPVFVRPLGVKPAGREVRVYKAANRTTCLFWWPGPGAARVGEVSGFEFVSLNRALRAAEGDRRHLTLIAPDPTETSARPEPPTK
ncbi:MAG: VWA domain-containing protein, partial [Planctomycetes bacterium]|nr:VWA domain-containing protein [Planctomycetota bacterium]